MKDSIKIDGKIYISSRRAAEISRYSNDYIGQLCRGGKINSRMMGRAWFVDQDNLLEYKKSAEEALQTRYRMAGQVQHRIYADAGGAAVIVPSAKITTRDTFTHRQSSTRGQRIMASVLILLICAAGSVTLDRVGIIDISSMINNVHVYGLVDTADLIAQDIDAQVDSSAALFGSLFSARSISPQTAALYSSVATSTDTTTDSSFNGIAVVPSRDSDEYTKQQIRNSFSDAVTITPDQSGTAGVITPVFKKTTGDEFMYVLVPVKDTHAQ
jgi:hypothetical protein